MSGGGARVTGGHSLSSRALQQPQCHTDISHTDAACTEIFTIFDSNILKNFREVFKKITNEKVFIVR